MILHLGTEYSYYCYRVIRNKYIIIDEYGAIDFVDRYDI